MEPKGSLPHSQMPATCPYPEQCTYIPLSLPVKYQTYYGGHSSSTILPVTLNFLILFMQFKNTDRKYIYIFTGLEFISVLLPNCKNFQSEAMYPLLLGDSSNIEKSQFYILWGPPKMA
jgi:hypothetical protein